MDAFPDKDKVEDSHMPRCLVPVVFVPGLSRAPANGFAPVLSQLHR